LQQNEKEALKNVRNIFQKHGTLNRCFFRPEREAWRSAARELSKQEYEILRVSFSVFLPRFSVLWEKEKNNLQSIAAAFSKTPPPVGKALKTLYALYAPHRKSGVISVFLLTSPITKRIVNGGGKITSKTLALECSKITAKNNSHNLFARVLLHETIHTTFEDRIKGTIATYLKTKDFSSIKRELMQSTAYHEACSFLGPIKEMIAVSLLPEGYLAERYFSANVRRNLLQRKSVREHRLKHTYYDFMLFAIWELYPLAREYCEQQRSIDTRYIRETVDTWRRFNQTNLSRWILEK